MDAGVTRLRSLSSVSVRGLQASSASKMSAGRPGVMFGSRVDVPEILAQRDVLPSDAQLRALSDWSVMCPRCGTPTGTPALRRGGRWNPFPGRDVPSRARMASSTGLLGRSGFSGRFLDAK